MSLHQKFKWYTCVKLNGLHEAMDDVPCVSGVLASNPSYIVLIVCLLF